MHRTINLLAVLSCLLVFPSACGLFGGDDKKEGDIPGKIVFSMQEEAGAGNFQIYVMNADGSELTQLTHFEKAGAYDPAWSPDGRHIVFHTPALTPIGTALVIMDADGSNQRLLHNPAPDDEHIPPLRGEHPVWSPDGKKIAFDRFNSLFSDIYVYDFETDTVQQLTNFMGAAYPSWSPDGSQIVFNSDIDYRNKDTLRFLNDFYVINADGSGLHRLTEMGYVENPVWTADNSIIFRNNSSSAGLYELDIQSRKITEIKASNELLLFPLSWFPDNSLLLVYAHNVVSSADNALWVMDFKRNTLREILKKPSHNASHAIRGGDLYWDKVH